MQKWVQRVWHGQLLGGISYLSNYWTDFNQRITWIFLSHSMKIDDLQLRQLILHSFLKLYHNRALKICHLTSKNGWDTIMTFKARRYTLCLTASAWLYTENVVQYMRYVNEIMCAFASKMRKLVLILQLAPLPKIGIKNFSVDLIPYRNL